MRTLTIAIAALLTHAAALAQGAGPIPADPATGAPVPLPDYSYAGYGFGVAAIPASPATTIDVTRYGVIADDGLDDSKAVQKALAAARAVAEPVTVRFPRGRVQITEVLRIDRSDIVLQGAGSQAGGTELWFPRPLELVDSSAQWDELRDYLVREDKRERQPANNIDYLFSEWSWSGGFIFTGPADTRPVSYNGTADKRDRVLAKGAAGTQFARRLTVDNAARLKVGQVVQLQWFSVNGKDSAIIRSIYGETDLAIGSHHWSFPDRPTVAQATRIVAIEGRTLTLGDPLLHDVSAAQPAVVADWPHLQRVGIRDMALRFPEGAAFGHHLEQGYNGIYLTGVFDGWIDNLVIDNADSGILTDNAASFTIRNVATTGARRAHYAVHLGAVHNALVTGLRVENPVIHPLTVNTRSTRAVFTHAEVLQDGLLDQHSGSNHQNLFDDVLMHITPQWRDDAWTYRLWEGGGAGYWKPGHGRYNTTYNVRLATSGMPAGDAPLRITSGLEGPGARIVGISAGTHPIEIVYRPQPVSADIGTIPAVPSLYEYQLAKRRAAANRTAAQ